MSNICLVQRMYNTFKLIHFGTINCEITVRHCIRARPICRQARSSSSLWDLSKIWLRHPALSNFWWCNDDICLVDLKLITHAIICSIETPKMYAIQHRRFEHKVCASRHMRPRRQHSQSTSRPNSTSNYHLKPKIQSVQSYQNPTVNSEQPSPLPHTPCASVRLPPPPKQRTTSSTRAQ